MPRDGSGNYTLPPGNPVFPGTVIEATWANPTMSDIATALTDSLSRTGSGGMLVAFLNADGTVGAPGMSWTNEPSSGWYRAALNDFWYSVGNENIFRITKTGIELAAGKTSINISDPPVKVQDTDPSPLVAGREWFESDTGDLYLKYQNPDTTFTWIGVNAAGVQGATGAIGPTGATGPIGPAGSAGSTNRIINGKFAVDQRLAHNALSVTTFLYGVDRWFGNAAGGGIYSLTSFADPLNDGEWRLRSVVTTADAALAAGDFYGFGQDVEGNNVADFNLGTATAKSFTFACELESSIAATVPISFRNGIRNRSYVTTVALAANTRTPVTIIVPGDTTGTWAKDFSSGMAIVIGFGVGSTLVGPSANVWQAGNFVSVAGVTNIMATNGNTFYIRNARLYLGAADQGVDQRPFAEEFELCRRYFQKSYQYPTVPGTATTTGQIQVRTLNAGQGTFENSSFIAFTPDLRVGSGVATIYSPVTGAANRVRDVSAAADIVVSSLADRSSRNLGSIVTPGVVSAAGNFITWHWTVEAEL